MQAIKEKLSDMSQMRKAKAEAKEEEREEVDLAKTRIQVAKEVRMAREAEAAMDLHVNKAAQKVAEQEAKFSHHTNADQFPSDNAVQDPHSDNYGTTNLGNEGYSTHYQPREGNWQDPSSCDGCDTAGNLGSNAAAGAGTGYPTNSTTAEGPPTNNLL